MAHNFNPEKFGFDMSFSQRVYGGSVAHGCYVAMSEKKGDLRLVIDARTTERLREIAGDRVSFGMDQKGRILVTKSTGSFGRKISKAATSTKSNITMGTMYEAYKDCMGKFVRLYVTPEVYDGGNAMVFSPNGKVDKI